MFGSLGRKGEPWECQLEEGMTGSSDEGCTSLRRLPVLVAK